MSSIRDSAQGLYEVAVRLKETLNTPITGFDIIYYRYNKLAECEFVCMI